MTMLTRRRIGLTAFAGLFATSFAAAQTPQTVRVRGTIPVQLRAACVAAISTVVMSA